MVNMYYQNQLDKSVIDGKFDYHYPLLKAIQINYIYRLVAVVAIILSSSYFLGIFWKIIVTFVIDWQNNDMVDVYNGYSTFYSEESYGFID